MGKVGFSREIGNAIESFDIKIDSQSEDIEISDTSGNRCFPTAHLIKELYHEIKRLEAVPESEEVY